MRIKALILAFILLLGTNLPVAYASDGEDTAFFRAESFLSQLGITEGVQKSSSDDIDRANFAAMIVKGVNYNTNPADTTQFADCDDNPFKEEIYMARDLGIVNGTSPRTFSPDAGITPSVAAKMLVSALGYSEKAEAMGGYPSGYYNIASSLDLFENVNTGSNAISVRDACVLVYNMLNADKAIITSVIGNEFIFETIKGRNLLTENFGFSSVTGVITTAGYWGTETKLTGKGKIGIGTNVFSSDIKNVSQYLGYSAQIWYNASQNKAYAVDVDWINSSIKIKSSDILGYENNTIIVDNGTDKGAKYRCDSLTFIQNGASLPYTSSSFLFDNGEVTLIDNDGDGKIEYVVAKRGDYFIIKAKSTIDNSIYDGNSTLGTVVFDNEDESSYSVIIDGQEATFDDLKTGMSAQIFMREDRGHFEISAISEKKTATVTEMTDDAVFLDGEKYKLNTYFTSNGNTLSVGNTYTLYIAPDGTISAIADFDFDNEKYGIYLDFEAAKGLSSSARIKILTTNDEAEIFELADRVFFEGYRKDYNDPAIEAALIDTVTDIPNYQLIKYKVSSDGKISSIDMPYNDETTWDVETQKPLNNTLTKYVWNRETYYRDGYAIPHVYMQSAVLFRVPVDFDLKDPTQAVKKLYADDEFGILTSGDFADGEKLDVDAFDFDKSFVPSAVLVRRPLSSSLTRNDSSCIVTKVSQNAVTNDGEPAVKLYTFANGRHKEYFVKPEVYAGFTIKPSKGDVIRLKTGKDGYVSGVHVAVDFKGMQNSEKATVNYKSPVVEAVHGSLTYLTGTVYNASDNFLVINEKFASAGSYWFKAPTGTFSMPLANTEFVLYNERSQIAKSVSADKLISSLHAGVGYGSFVACECIYGQAVKVFIYEY